MNKGISVVAAVITVFALFAGIWLGVLSMAAEVETSCRMFKKWEYQNVILAKPIKIQCSVPEAS